MSTIKPLADDFKIVYESSHPSTLYCGSPGITRLPSGRIVLTLDNGNRFRDWKYTDEIKQEKFGKVYTTDDQGESFTLRTEYPFYHARPFVAGDSLYVLGHWQDLMIIRSDDGGETWSQPIKLTHGEKWHQAPCNVHYANGCVYLVMERMVYTDFTGWGVNALAPVLMRGKITDDLLKRDNWTFASELAFRDAIHTEELNYFGVPFFETEATHQVEVAPGRNCAPPGWLETNVVQFVDPDHYWYDPSGHTFHLWMRAHTGGTGYAAIAKVVENEDGTMTTMLETAPSGKKVVYVPCPGGQMKFHILYDEVSKLYWLISSQARDSMTRAERLPADRYGLPNNERDRLQLHFSKNCIDWCFAGLVAAGKFARQSRQYASMVIDGDDLHVLSRSGGEHSVNAHDAYITTLHTVKNFRKLVY